MKCVCKNHAAYYSTTKAVTSTDKFELKLNTFIMVITTKAVTNVTHTSNLSAGKPVVRVENIPPVSLPPKLLFGAMVNIRANSMAKKVRFHTSHDGRHYIVSTQTTVIKSDVKIISFNLITFPSCKLFIFNSPQFLLLFQGSFSSALLILPGRLDLHLSGRIVISSHVSIHDKPKSMVLFANS